MKHVIDDVDVITNLITTAAGIQQALDGHGFSLGVIDTDDGTVPCVALTNLDDRGAWIGVTVEEHPALIHDDGAPQPDVLREAIRRATTNRLGDV
ncbi:hypothetical protein ACFY7C_19470 [Streptomyces sp. NPDC012769]|uniref:hypothetical protein n=1 Tax=Streptomyces sp. NPDC012769 TaxID=3364848 RepID=UPI0036B46B2E